MSDEEMINKMQSYRQGMRRKMIFIVPLVIVAIAAVAGIVMALWNCIIPEVFTTVRTVTYWQALGILVLCKILFSSFRGGHRGGWKGRHMQHRAWKEKWMHMNDEEKAKFKEEWKNRCQPRC